MKKDAIDLLQAETKASPVEVVPSRQGGDKYVVPLFLLLVSDFLVFFSSILIAYWARVDWIVPFYPLKAGPMPILAKYLHLAGAYAVLGITVFGFAGFYRHRRGMTRFVSPTRIGVMVLLATLLLLASMEMYRGYSYSRLAVGMAFIFAMILCVSSHAALSRVQKAMIRRGIGFLRTLLVTTEENSQDLLFRLENTHGSLHHVVGVVLSDAGEEVSEVLGVPVLGDLESLTELCKPDRIDRLIFALPSHLHTRTLDFINLCEESGVEYRIVPDLFEILTMRVSVGDIDGLPTITLGETPLEGWGRFVKRTMDIVVSLALLLITLPVTLLSMALIKSTSHGPVFYPQERLGSDGERFTLYKLRSMYQDAEKTGIGWSVRNDPRVTPVGRILRRCDIDEFPQFFNVLKGDMSLVGPRPERPHYVDQFKANIPQYMKRHMVKSGITGWAQVHGLRGDTSIEERTRYDIYYVEHWSLWLDIRILLMTCFSFLRGLFRGNA